jgi:hypothetical protein
MRRTERYGLHLPTPGRAIALGVAVGIALALANPPVIARVRAPVLFQEPGGSVGPGISSA